jgi:peptidoglycan hydrolase-like protein with peptidoglycan-binding domain
MQGGLKLLGFHPGPVDGVIGPLTRTAVATFQRAEGLPDDGDLSRATEARLHQRIRSPAH